MPDTPAPQRLGRYDIVRVLGEGAMGVVYEGDDSRLHRKVAIKTILKSALDSDSAREYSKRFAREAQAVARLNHPNIVQVFDFAEEGDVAYIVMEFVRGRELKSFFEARERFALKEVVHIMAELCDALQFAHGAGIIHRDIKPANVMIDSQGRVKLTDFGVARITDIERTVSERTQAGAIIGTPAYMSPEQIQGNPLDRRSDVFSAGIILYEFLTSRKPFAGAGTWAIAKKILADDPEPPSTLNPDVPRLIDGVVAKALAKKVGERYQNARDFGFALQRAFEGLEQVPEEAERTVVLAPGSLPTAPAAAGEPTVLRTQAAGPRVKATELEFWRSIKDGSDPADFELYIEQFPNGIYAALARRRIAKLRGVASEGSAAGEQERLETEEAARREAEARQRLAEEKAEMEALLARREAEFQKREAELSAREAAAPRHPALAPALVAAAVAAAVAGGWYAFRPADPLEQRVKELTQLLEQSKQREAELAQSRQREAELQKALEVAKQREAEARQAGDVAKQRELAEQVRQREAEARKQAELTRQREAEAKRQAEAAEQRREEIARLQAQSGRHAAPAPAAEAPPPAETPKAAEVQRTETANSGGTAQPAAAATAAPKAAEGAKLASAAPAPVASATPTPTPEAMLARAIELENQGKNAEAARLLRRVTRESKGQVAGQAAKRLGDLLQMGVPGVSRDYAEALRYYDIARSNGVDVPVARGR